MSDTAEQHDDGEWDYESIEVKRVKRPAVVYSVRFAPEEIRAIREAAAAAGKTPSELIRQAALAAAKPTAARF